MSGICGYVCKKKNNDEIMLKKMLDCIETRGMDGTYKRSINQVFIGQRLLKTQHAISMEDCLKLNENILIAFDGEIYNCNEIRAVLEKQGKSVIGRDDGAVILSAYEFWGEDCIEHFNGIWAFCIYDIRNGKLFCSRDRFGVVPFYYIDNEEVFAFASEIKQLLPFLKNGVKANKEMLKRYLGIGITGNPGPTLFDGIYCLGGSHKLIYEVNNHRYNISQWYNLGRIRLSRRSYKENTRRFREVFEDAVRIRLNDGGIGASLSGGLDSSAVVCMAAKIMKNNASKLTTFTSCFDDKRYDEREFADAVIQVTGCTGRKVFPDMDKCLDTLDEMLYRFDEPFGSTSSYAHWCLLHEAKKRGCTILLDGQGADEQLAGYPPFQNVLIVSLLKSVRFIRLIRERAQHKKLYKRYEPFWTLKNLMRMAVLAYMPSFFIKRWRDKYTYRDHNKDFLENFAVIESAKRFFEGFNKSDEQAYILHSLMEGMCAEFKSEDRNAAAASVTLRFPFLDHRLVELLYSTPITHKLRLGVTKAVMRDALKSVLPKVIYERKGKLGFVTNENVWMIENKEVIRQHFIDASKRLAPLIDVNEAITWFDKNINTLQASDFRIWRVICAGHWANVFEVQI